MSDSALGGDVRRWALILCVAALGDAATWQDSLAEAQRLRAAGQVAAAERIYQQIIDSSKNLEPNELNSVAVEFFYQARYPEAEGLYRRALAAWDRMGPAAAADRAVTAANLGTLLKVAGRYAEAEPLLLSRYEQLLTSSGPDSVETARAASALAALYVARGQLDKAEPLAARAHSALAKHPELQATSGADAARTLASIWLAQGRVADAETLLKPLLGILQNSAAVGVYNDLASAELKQNHLAEAEALCRSGLEIARRTLPPQHPLLAVTLNNLAQAERFEKRYLEAEGDYREAIEIWKTALGPQNPDVARGLMNLGAFYHERGREAGAEDLYRQAAAIFEKSYGPDNPLTLVARNELGDVLCAENRFTESEKWSQATLEPLARTLGDEDSRVLRALTNYAHLLEKTDRPKQATAIRARIRMATDVMLAKTP